MDVICVKLNLAGHAILLQILQLALKFVETVRMLLERSVMMETMMVQAVVKLIARVLF